MLSWSVAGSVGGQLGGRLCAGGPLARRRSVAPAGDPKHLEEGCGDVVDGGPDPAPDLALDLAPDPGPDRGGSRPSASFPAVGVQAELRLWFWFWLWLPHQLRFIFRSRFRFVEAPQGVGDVDDGVNDETGYVALGPRMFSSAEFGDKPSPVKGDLRSDRQGPFEEVRQLGSEGPDWLRREWQRAGLNRCAFGGMPAGGSNNT